MIPRRAGIGLRAPHFGAVRDAPPAVGWFEVHTENYFGVGGEPWRCLEQVRREYPISLHGVGLSLGSTDPLDVAHLRRVQAVIDRVEPGLVSEHLCWSSAGGRHLNDLLPLPYTEEALAHVVERIARVQEILRRQILIENVSSYLQYTDSTIPEAEFLAEAAIRSGCGILLDVNNLYVTAVNQGAEPMRSLETIPAELVREVHLAGFTENRGEGGKILIDTHSRPVADAVWALYRSAVTRIGRVPTLIEWDADLPPLDVLVAEAAAADAILAECHADAA